VVCAFATLAGFDRDRVFYPTLLTVIATYYILFAVMGNSTPALGMESRGGGRVSRAGCGRLQEEPMVGCSRARRTRSIRLLSSTVHSEPGFPMWWPGFCLSFDILAGGFLAMLLMRRSGFALAT